MQFRQNVNIWRLDLGKPEGRARKWVTSTREQNNPNISPDGSKIAFESDRSGSREVWICDHDGSNATQVTSFGVTNTGTPRWSPDGKRLALDSRPGGEANVYTVEIGGVPHKLETGTHDNFVPSWSRDGRWIYFVGRGASGKLTAMKVSPDGGRAVPIDRTKSYYQTTHLLSRSRLTVSTSTSSGFSTASFGYGVLALTVPTRSPLPACRL